MSYDSLQRRIDYLRVSVTDRCNLRCVYCMPAEGVVLCSHDEILRYEEIARLVAVAAQLGLGRVRVTGGEPLARRGVAQLVGMLARTPGIVDLSMTTNGILLAEQAAALAAAGLQRVNISLDSLSPERYTAMTRRGRLQDALAGIEAARLAGLQPIKINMVVVRGLNDGEVIDFALKTVESGWHVRYIELMPLGQGGAWGPDGYVAAGEIRQRIESTLGPLQPAELSGCGPASTWRLPGAAGTIGFITPISEHFCERCNRLRLTADGRLLPCLMSETELDVRTPLRAGASDEVLRALFEEAISAKPAGHCLDECQVPDGRLMSRTGG